MIENLFFELVRVAVGAQERLSRIPSEVEWEILYKTCEAHAVLGVVFSALERLTEYGIKPPISILYEWIGVVEQIKQRNSRMNNRCIELHKIFAEVGLMACVLKGQGNALMYPEPLLRQSGDIDIWVDGSKDNVVGFVQKQFRDATIGEHHVEYPIFDDVMVEVHFKPVTAVSFLRDKHLQSYLNAMREAQFNHFVILHDSDEKIPIPSYDFNIVYQLAHMMRHFFSEGLGMRHLMDYYYLLMSNDCSKNKDISGVLGELGMLKFAKAIMWVLGEVFMLDRNKMVCSPDKKRGVIILKEIMETGNFGYGDKRFSKRLMNISTTMSLLVRNFKLIRLFPEEAIAAPISNVVYRMQK